MRTSYENVEAMIASLTDWQNVSWVRQGKPDEWRLKVATLQLDGDFCDVDVRGGAEVFEARLPALTLMDGAGGMH